MKYRKFYRLVAIVFTFAGAARAADHIDDFSKDWIVGSQDSAYAQRAGNTIRIGNRFLERVYRITHGTVATAQFIKKVSGRDPGVQQTTEFGLHLSGAMSGDLTAADFKLMGISGQASDTSLRVESASLPIRKLWRD